MITFSILSPIPNNKQAIKQDTYRNGETIRVAAKIGFIRSIIQSIFVLLFFFLISRSLQIKSNFFNGKSNFFIEHLD